MKTITVKLTLILSVDLDQDENVLDVLEEVRNDAKSMLGTTYDNISAAIELIE